MGYERRTLVSAETLTATQAWDLTTLVAVGSSGDKTRVKGFFMKGMYWVNQASEVVTQYGTIGICLMRFPDTVSSPDPDWLFGSLQNSAPDAQILSPMLVHSGGQNNPVLFTYKYRAINVSPGQNLYLGLYVFQESGASINHQIQIGAQWVESND
jgi:hypothetical protein